MGGTFDAPTHQGTCMYIQYTCTCTLMSPLDCPKHINFELFHQYSMHTVCTYMHIVDVLQFSDT